MQEISSELQNESFLGETAGEKKEGKIRIILDAVTFYPSILMQGCCQGIRIFHSRISTSVIIKFHTGHSRIFPMAVAMNTDNRRKLTEADYRERLAEKLAESIMLLF